MFPINKNYIVYRWINRVNSKSYIGITCDPSARKRAHKNGHSGSVLSKAIAKYGVKNFEYTILESGLPLNEAIDKEIAYIEEFNSFGGGYNLTKGGEFGDTRKISDEQAMEIIMNPKCTSDIAKEYGLVDATVSSLRSGHYRPYLDRTGAPEYEHKLKKLDEHAAMNIIMNSSSHEAAAVEYGVSYSTIVSVRNGARWKYLNRSLAPNYTNGKSPYNRGIL